MFATIKYRSKTFRIDLSNPIDISIPLRGDGHGINAWYLDPPTMVPHRAGDFVGSVLNGAPVNFNDISFNPHAHVTHTECLGHITSETHSINASLKRYFFLAELITVAPEKKGNDFIISQKQLQYGLGQKKREAVVIRTLPNTNEKMMKSYSHANPPYFTETAMKFLKQKGIKHLLVDLPSVDKEKDDGKLLAHKAFWDIHGDMRHDATITEFIFVNNAVVDGTYVLNLQVAPFENDASPSRPILYKIH